VSATDMPTTATVPMKPEQTRCADDFFMMFSVDQLWRR